MKIKFNKDVVLINIPLSTAIGVGTPLTPEHCLPKDENGDIKYFDGAVPTGISKIPQQAVKANTVIFIYPNYNYNKETNELYFRCAQEIGPDYSLCFSNVVDTTCYYVENLASSDFEILE